LKDFPRYQDDHPNSFTQFEVIIYYAFGMEEMATHGWKEPMSQLQSGVMYALTALILALILAMGMES
jgi:hypothetical protein